MLPQLKIKRKARTIPFGYKTDDTGDYLIPIESELKALEEAKKNYQKAINLKPDFVNAYFNLGLVFQNLQDYEQAMKNHKKAIELL